MLTVNRSAEDSASESHRKVAIKKVTDIFNDFDSALRQLREIKLITRLRHSNVSSEAWELLVFRG